MVINHSSIKPIINTIFLTLSCFLIVYFLVQLTDNILIKIGIGVFAISLDIFMQYVFGLGKSYLSGHKIKAGILFFCYTIYVLVYAIPSAVGFFAVEVSMQETAASKIEITDNINKTRMLQISQTIDNLNRQLETESKTGFGNRSKTILDKIDSLVQEQKLLEEDLKVIKTSKKVSKNLFKSLSEVFGLPENILKILIFGISTAMLYLGLILTSWDIKVEEAVTEITATKEPTDLYSKFNDDKKDLITYVNAAIRDTGKLNGNPRIIELTGLPLDQCIKFRDWLMKLKIDGIPAITIRQGGGDVNIPKHKILKAIEEL